MTGIGSIPLDLRVAILKELADIGDLSAATATNTSFAEAARGSPTIVGHVLANEIHHSLWPLAVAIWQIRTCRRTLQVCNGQDAWLALRDCLLARPEDAWEHLCKVKLPEARKFFHRLHQAIDIFTTEYISQALVCLASRDSLHQPVYTASANEILCVQRAFYLFEILCCIFDGNHYSCWDFTWSQPLNLEFDPWVNEQIASVYEFLLSKVSISKLPSRSRRSQRFCR